MLHNSKTVKINDLKSKCKVLCAINLTVKCKAEAYDNETFVIIYF